MLRIAHLVASAFGKLRPGWPTLHNPGKLLALHDFLPTEQGGSISNQAYRLTLFTSVVLVFTLTLRPCTVVSGIAFKEVDFASKLEV